MKTILSIIIALVCLARIFAAEPEPLSLSIATEGRFAAGYSWDLTLAESGEASLTIHAYPDPILRTFQIPATQLAQLRETLEREDFFGLTQQSYGETVASGSTTTLTITRGEETKRVAMHFLSNWVRSEPEKLVEPARALRVLALVRTWFADEEAVDLRPYDQRIIQAADDFQGRQQQ